MLHAALSLIPLALATSCAPLPPAQDGFAEPATVSLTADPVLDFAPIHFGDGPKHAFQEPYFPGANYDPAVADPASILGQPIGSRLAWHDEIVQAFRALAASSPRVQLDSYGRTYEGRELLRAVITSEQNLERLGELRKGLQRLADPRGLSAAEGQRLVQSLPAVAWLGYSIHGDELSGADASMAVAYHLAASTDADIVALLDDVIVVIDPAMNPDGRERTVGQIRESFGYVENLDYASMHRGRWPGGRGNHYLFDMNRDWMSGLAPETRGRWRAVLDLPPQLFIDGHEMSGLDTYLFYPQSEPHHPELTPRQQALQSLFADDHAVAFDAHAWGYYSREWADAWYPAYSDFWGTLNSAVGMLYEQGSTFGQPLRRASGEVVTYRESVFGHVTGSLANLTTLAGHREEILAGYLEARRANVSEKQRDAKRMFVIVPGANGSRERDLVRRLVAQGIEVQRADESFTTANGLGPDLLPLEREIPAGAYLIPVRQPQAPLVRAFLEFDPRMSQSILELERGDLEAGRGSRMYDITAWDLGRAFDLDCLWADAESTGGDPVTSLPEPGGMVTLGAGLTEASAAVAWAVDGADDLSIAFAAAAMERGLVLHLADKPFRAGGKSYPAGSLLLRRHENALVVQRDGLTGLAEHIASAADATHCSVLALATLRSPDEGADLGGGTFTELARPRVAILTGSGVSVEDFGHLWRQIDEDLRLPASLLEAESLGRYDLRRFNVLILPPGAGRAAARNQAALDTWVSGGGTLIAVGSSASALAGTDLSRVTLRRNQLDELEDYAWATSKERAARTVTVDPDALYGRPAPATSSAANEDSESGDENGGDHEAELPSFLDAAPDKETADAWMRRFSPSGVLLAAEVAPEHWLTSGRRATEMPVFHEGSAVLLAPVGVDVPLRFVESARLRLGGLLWPEAAERIGDSIWASVERHGDGQVILFANPPTYRGFFKGTSRFFANAVILGPGAGASQPIGL